MNVRLSKYTLSVVLLITVMLGLVAIDPRARIAQAATVPQGFTIDQKLITGLKERPTSITWIPAEWTPGSPSYMLIANKSGTIQVARAEADGSYTLLTSGANPFYFIDIAQSVNNTYDRGLLSITIHPDFPAKPYIYLLYVSDEGLQPNQFDKEGARVSKLVRYTIIQDAQKRPVAKLDSQVILIGKNSTAANIGDPDSFAGPASCDGGAIPAEQGGDPIQDCVAMDSTTHAMGTVAFGFDGSLFVTSGEAALTTAEHGASANGVDPRALRAQNLDSLNGKILRIDPLTGKGLSTNPFYNGNADANRSKVYSYGVRNPFRMTFDPETGEPWFGDVGWGLWEEINTGRAKNFGWPCYEGGNGVSNQQPLYRADPRTKPFCDTLYARGLSAVTPSVYAYDHKKPDGTKTGAAAKVGVFYPKSEGNFPAEYRGALFLIDYNSDWIRYLKFGTAGQVTANDFVADLSEGGGPVQLVLGPDRNLYVINYRLTSFIERIRYIGAGNTPPVAVASATPNNGKAPLQVQFSSTGTYDAEPGDLAYKWDFDNNGSVDSTLANPSHIYTQNGTFTAKLTVTDSGNASNSATLNIYVGNSRPVAKITSPAPGARFNVGDTIAFTGSATDADNESVTLNWDVLVHHNEHEHSNQIPSTTGPGGSFKAPDHGDGTWLELILTAVDSRGLDSEPIRLELRPNTVELTIDSQPTGLTILYGEGGATYTTPFKTKPSVNSNVALVAPVQQGIFPFVAWTDGNTNSLRTVKVTDKPAQLIARYRGSKVILPLIRR